MNKIKKASRIIGWLCFIAIAILPVVQVIGWLSFDRVRSSYAIGWFNPAHIPLDKLQIITPLPQSSMIMGFFVSMIPILIIMLIVYFIMKLFRLYASGSIFTQANTDYIKKIGWTMLVGQLIKPFYESLMSLVLTMNNPVGQRTIVVGLSGVTFGLIVVALMIITVSWVMDEGRVLKENEDLTI